MITLVASLFLLIVASPGDQPTNDRSAFVGIWEGESKCMVPDSPCHGEHVVYKIKESGQKLTIAGYKIVNGEKQYTGDLRCASPKSGVMHCSADRPNKNRIDDWVFELKDKTMEGTLYMDKERIIFRKIHIEKK
jgi:hypothetical protein